MTFDDILQAGVVSASAIAAASSEGLKNPTSARLFKSVTGFFKCKT
jgi:hypothetical protein